MTELRAWLDEAQRRCKNRGDLPGLRWTDADLSRALSALRAVLDKCDVCETREGPLLNPRDVRRVIEAAIHPATPGDESMSRRIQTIVSFDCDWDQCDDTTDNIDSAGDNAEQIRRNARHIGWYIGVGGTAYCPEHAKEMLR